MGGLNNGLSAIIKKINHIFQGRFWVKSFSEFRMVKLQCAFFAECRFFVFRQPDMQKNPFFAFSKWLGAMIRKLFICLLFAICYLSNAATAALATKVVVTGGAGRTGQLVFSKLLKDSSLNPVALVRTDESAKKLYKLGASKDQVHFPFSLCPKIHRNSTSHEIIT